MLIDKRPALLIMEIRANIFPFPNLTHLQYAFVPLASLARGFAAGREVRLCGERRRQGRDLHPNHRNICPARNSLAAVGLGHLREQP